VYCLIICLQLLVSDNGANDSGNLEELDFQDYEQQPVRERGK
jgi:hypothetical protein